MTALANESYCACFGPETDCQTLAIPSSPGVVLRGYLLTNREASADDDHATGEPTHRDGTASAPAPLLLVHGLASNAQLWNQVAVGLASRGHPVAAIDLRGHGRSDKPEAGYDFETIVEDLRVTLDALTEIDGAHWRRPVLVGQSLGGNLVLEFAARHPAALSATACVDGGTIELRERFPTWAQCAAELAPPDLSAHTPAELQALLRASHEGWPEEGIQAMLACFTTDRDGHVAPRLTRARHMLLLRELWEHPASALFGQITVPVLLIPAVGGTSVEFTDDKSRDIQRALATLPVASAHWFYETDHDIHAQRPAELADVLHAAIDDGFLRQHGGARESLSQRPHPTPTDPNSTVADTEPEEAAR